MAQVIEIISPETHAKVLQWAVDRNLIEGSNPQAQFLKLVEEIGEILTATNADEFNDGVGDTMVVITILAEQLGIKLLEVELVQFAPNPAETLITLGQLAQAIAKQKRDVIPQALGSLVFQMNMALSVAAAERGLQPATLQACYASAYDVIKDRKGKMIDGVFVREE